MCMIIPSLPSALLPEEQDWHSCEHLSQRTYIATSGDWNSGEQAKELTSQPLLKHFEVTDDAQTAEDCIQEADFMQPNVAHRTRHCSAISNNANNKIKFMMTLSC